MIYDLKIDIAKGKSTEVKVSQVVHKDGYDDFEITLGNQGVHCPDDQPVCEFVVTAYAVMKFNNGSFVKTGEFSFITHNINHSFNVNHMFDENMKVFSKIEGEGRIVSGYLKSIVDSYKIPLGH